MKKFHFLIYLLLFSSFQCSEKEFFESIEPPKFEVDNSILSQKLELVSKIKLQENDESILSDVSDLKLNPDGDEILLIDPTNRTANLYDYNTGKLLHWLKAGDWLTKFVAETDTEAYYDKYYKMNVKKIRFEDYESYYSKDYIKSFLSNRFYKALYVNNSIYLLTLVYFSKLVGGKYKVGANTTILTKLKLDLSIDDIIYLYPKRNKSYAFPVNFYCNNDNNFIVSSINNGVTIYEKKFDSLPSYSLYTADGNFINICSYLPEKLSQKGLNYLFFEYAFLEKIREKLILSLGFDLSIYEFNDSLYKPKLFDLYNLPSNNDSGYYYYPKIIDYLDQSKRNTIEKRAYFIDKLFPIRIVNMMNCNDNILFHIGVLDSTKIYKFYSVLQEYTLEGKLISQTNINDEENSQIKWISFDNKNNYLLIIRRSKSGWYLEKRKWEKLN